MGHTPGPWNVGHTTPRLTIQAADGIGLAVVTWPDSPNYRADAALLAAAPDMLEALQSIAELDASYYDYDIFTLRQAVSQYKAAAMAAIAKATGAQP